MKNSLFWACALICVAAFSPFKPSAQAQDNPGILFNDAVELDNGWYYSEALGYVYPLGGPWVYSFSFNDFQALFPLQDAGSYHQWDSRVGWSYIDLNTTPWLYIYNVVEQPPGNDGALDTGWYYSFGISGNGTSPHSYFSADTGETTSTKLTIEIVNGTADSPAGAGIPDEDIYVTLYGDSGASFNPTSILLNDSMTFNSHKNQAGNFSFTTTDFSSGRLYVSFNNKNEQGQFIADSGKMPTSQSQIDAFSQTQPRNDKIEMTYTSSPAGGAANLTAVDYFGIPMRIETIDASGAVLQSFTYFSKTDDIVSKLEAIDSSITTDAVIKDTTSAAHFLRVASPQQVYSGSNPYPSMSPYLSSSNVNGQTITIAGHYNGATVPGVATYPPVDYNYSGTMADSGSITLTGTMTNTSSTPYQNPNQNITIQVSDLESGIYGANPPYMKGSDDGTIGDNDAYSAIVRDLLAGFNAGFVGRLNSEPSSQWWGQTPFVEQGGNKYFNQYADVIQTNSQSYGFAFSDRLRTQLAFFNPQVATLRITILSDDMLEAPKVYVKSVTDDSIELEWDRVDGADSYKIFHTPPQAGTTIVKPKPANNPAKVKHIITGLKKGTPYAFEVWSVANKAGGGTVESGKFYLTASTSGTAETVTGEGQWRANFSFHYDLVEDGDIVYINNTKTTLNKSTVNSGDNVSISYTYKQVSSFTKVEGGSGYSIDNPPTAVISGGDGFNASASPVVDGLNEVNALFTLNPGFGYQSAPTVSFTNTGGGSGAQYTANMINAAGTDGNGDPIPVGYLPIPAALQFENGDYTKPQEKLNEIVFRWMRSDDSTVVFESVLYLTTKGYAQSSDTLQVIQSNGGLAKIVPGTDKTYLEGNKNFPTVGSGQNDDWNLFLTVQPADQL